MNWTKVTPKSIEKLVHGRQYLIAYKMSYNPIEYHAAWWYQRVGQEGYFHEGCALMMPDYYAKITAPK